MPTTPIYNAYYAYYAYYAYLQLLLRPLCLFTTPTTTRPPGTIRPTAVHFWHILYSENTFYTKRTHSILRLLRQGLLALYGLRNLTIPSVGIPTPGVVIPTNLSSINLSIYTAYEYTAYETSHTPFINYYYTNTIPTVCMYIPAIRFSVGITPHGVVIYILIFF